MTEWISRHSDVLQIVVNLALMAVWLLYLQVIVSNMRRQRRPQILIATGAGGSWFVANLGLEPIYVADVIAQTETAKGTVLLRLTDRSDGSEQDPTNPVWSSNNGPLESGKFAMIGYQSDIVRHFRDDDERFDTLQSVTILVLAEAAATDTMVGASRTYRRNPRGDDPWFTPAMRQTRQVRRRPEVARLIAVMGDSSDSGSSSGGPGAYSARPAY